LLNLLLKLKRSPKFYRYLLVGVLINSLVSASVASQPILLQTTIPCQLSAAARAQKESLRQVALQGNRDAQNRYKALLIEQAKQLQECRQQNWPRNQAIWLRLYPCDIRPGSLERILDSIVDKGYNQVYVEVFYDSQVLLPQSDNPTPWQSVVKEPGSERVDLLAQAIQKGQERGLKVYAWLFTMNFGYSYAQRPDRQSVLARNGSGQDNLAALYQTVVDEELAKGDDAKAFIDPYSPQARQDYNQLVQAVVKRKPDGVLFDYVRYPRSTGEASVATKVQDLWIYSEATQQVLYQRALNNKGLALIRRFLNQGYVSGADIAQIDQMYPEEGEPLWQGRDPDSTKNVLAPEQRQPFLQWDLWQLSVAHAAQGVLDFLADAIAPAQQQNIPTGAVFFPGGNRAVGQAGYDSRIQPWDRFPSSMEWHPMVYKACGDTSCILTDLQRVLNLAPQGTQIKPALAGNWGQSVSNRPPLEVQMQAIRLLAPQIDTVSHFAFSWQEPQLDRERKFCRL
jgi:Glycosyl hydrolase-like 10